MGRSLLSAEGFKVLFQRGYLRQACTPVMAVAVTLLFSAVLLLGVNITRLQDSHARDERTNEMLMQIGHLETGIALTESSIRGYALTSDPMFLDFQRMERANVARAMAKIAALTGDEAQARRFAEVRAAVKARMDTLSSLIEMGPEQAAAVGQAMRDPAKRQIMRLARAKMAEFREMELKLLRDHQKTAEKVSKHNYALAVGIVVVAFVLGALSIALAQFGYGTRPKA